MTIDNVDIPESPKDDISIITDNQELNITTVEDTKKTNTVQSFETFTPIPEKNWNTETETLALPTSNLDTVKNVLNDAPNVRLDDNKQGREWSEALNDSLDALYLRDSFDKTVNRNDSEFVQAIDSEKMPLCAGIPNLRYNVGEKVAGERAVLRIRSLVGLGTILQIPLWHSGFWVTIKAPSEGALLELQRRLIEEKINLGRNTHGLAFANTSVYVAGWLMDFVIQHIYDTTIKATDIDLRKMIKALDIPSIVWGLACSIWPNGFQYTRACSVDPEKCNHVVKEKINLGKLLWVDRKALTAWQISHMTNRGGSTMSIESIERYCSEFTIGRGRTIKVNENVSINLKVPNIDEYINSGYKWVNNIVNMIDGSLTEQPTDAARNHYINELGKSTNMRQYVHWIESIDAAGNIVDDVETIEQIVDTFSSIDEVRIEYFNDILKFIDDSTMAVIAIPTYTCPSCQEEQPATLPRFTHLLNIDVISCFFILLVQKLRKIHSR